MTDNRADIRERVEYVVSLNAALLERSGYSQEAYGRVVLNTMVQTPAIVECDVSSLQQALLDAMNAGLVPDGREAAIVPFKGKAQLIIMIEGRMKLAHQATKGLVVRSLAVYEGDEWEYSEGLHPRLHHVPNPGASNATEDLIYVYATAQMPGALESQFDVMSRATVDRYRAYSASPARGPWTTHFEEMAKNAVLKRLLKRLPKSSRAPLEAPELELVDTLEDAAALSGVVVDTTTGEIMDAPAPALAPPAPPPTPSTPKLPPTPNLPTPTPALAPAAAPGTAEAQGAPPPNEDDSPF